MKLFASTWPNGAAGTAWTVVNRDNNSHAGPAINTTGAATVATGSSLNYYDLWFGEAIKPPSSSGQIPLNLEAAGYGAVLATSNTTAEDPELAAFLAKMKAMQASSGPIQQLNNTWTYELQQRIPIAPAPIATMPDNMVKINGGPYRFVVKGIEIEGGGKSSIKNNPFGVDFQYPWEAAPNRFHDYNLSKRTCLPARRAYACVCLCLLTWLP